MKDQLSIKDIVQRIVEIYKMVSKNWYWVVVISLLMAILFGYRSYSSNRNYMAEMKFVVESESSGLNAFSGLLGSLGINRGGSKHNPYKIEEVAKSKNVLGQLLFEKIDGTGDYLANHIIDDYDLDELWRKKNESLVGFRFSDSAFNSFEGPDRQVFLKIISLLIGSTSDNTEAIINISHNIESGVFSIKGRSLSEVITLNSVNNWFGIVKYFFEEKITLEKTKSNELLQSKVDSLDGVLNYKLVKSSRLEDKSRNLFSTEMSVEKRKIDGEIFGLVSAISELRKSLELSKYEIENSKPYFMVIDRPYSPLVSIKSSWLKGIIIGLAIGAFLSTGMIILLSIFKEVVES